MGIELITKYQLNKISLLVKTDKIVTLRYFKRTGEGIGECLKEVDILREKGFVILEEKGYLIALCLNKDFTHPTSAIII